MSSEFLVPPPNSVTVDHDHKPVLYLPDGLALVRQAGFRAGVTHAVPILSEARREVSGERRTGAGR